MNISIRKPLKAGSIHIPAQRYEVTVDQQRSEVVLAGVNATFKLDALQRSSKARVTTPSVQLRQVVGEPRWLLIVRMAPANEWVASLEEA